MLVLSLCASLDAASALTALLLTGQLPGLAMGRAAFTDGEKGLKAPLSPVKTSIITPQACHR